MTTLLAYSSYSSSDDMGTLLSIVQGILAIVYLILPWIFLGEIKKIRRLIDENNTQRRFEASKILKGIGEATSILSGSTSEEQE